MHRTIFNVNTKRLDYTTCCSSPTFAHTQRASGSGFPYNVFAPDVKCNTIYLFWVSGSIVAAPPAANAVNPNMTTGSVGETTTSRAPM